MSKTLIAMLAAAGLCAAQAQAAPLTKDQYKAEQERISADYKADKQRCESLKGNAQDVCELEAKGKEKVAKAQAEADYKNTEGARRDARKAKVEAEYAVAKERCDDLSGERKSACVKEAQATQAKGMADLKNAG